MAFAISSTLNKYEQRHIFSFNKTQLTRRTNLSNSCEFKINLKRLPIINSLAATAPADNI